MVLGGQAAEEDPKRLKKENDDLKRKLRIAEDVIALLREFPAQRTRAQEKREKQEKGDAPQAVAKPATKSATASTPSEASGGEKRSIPEHVKRRSGMRRSTVPGSTTPNPELADGERPHPAP